MRVDGMHAAINNPKLCTSWNTWLFVTGIAQFFLCFAAEVRFGLLVSMLSARKCWPSASHYDCDM